MIKHQNSNMSSYDHDELINLIPWYVKGKLTANESAAVKEHLTACESCRQELASCKVLANLLPKSTELWRPSAGHFSNILAEVDKLEAAEKPKQAANTAPKKGFFQRISQLLAQTPLPVRWTLAAESLAFAMLVAIIVLPGVSNLKTGQPGAFETLSNAAPTSSSGQLLRVVFSDEITAKELSDLLLQTRAQIRQGPTLIGAYTIEIPSEAATQAQATLKAHPKVKLVLPVTADTPKS